MATDSLRAAIINEVEESFNQAQDQNKLSLRMVWSAISENFICKNMLSAIL